MDIEYLQNVMGSPYVTEGAFDRLKARGAQAMGAIGATAGYQIKNPAETKIQSLWWGFISSLNRVMMDWKNQVSPMFGSDVKIPVEVRRIKKALDSIAQTLTPNPYINKPVNQNLKTLTKEGLWDAAKRDMGLNKALASNNPTSILNSYKNYVLSLFQNFMKDAMKSTKLPPKEIYSILAKIQPKENGWQATGNMQKIVQQLQKLQTPTVPTNAPAANLTATIPTQNPSVTTTPTVPPPFPTQQPSTAVAGSSAPSSTPPVAQQQSTFPPQTQTPYGQGLPSSDTDSIPSQDMPYVIIAALRIIIDAAKSDEDHALGLFGTTDPKTKVKSGYPPLATNWDSGPSVTASLQEIDVGPKPKSGGIKPDDDLNPDKEADKKAKEEIIYKEYPGEFLYNFHSRYSKHPGTPFTIRVTPINISSEIKNIPGASVEVWWHNDGGTNQIYVSEVKDGKKTRPTLIIEFDDHEINPKSGASTPGNINFFSIEKVVQNSNPYSNSKLSSAPADVKSEIKGLEDDVLRALLATVQRKNMEFVSRGWQEKKAADKANQQVKAEQSTSAIGDDGSLTYTDDVSKQQVSVSMDQIKQILKGPLEPASLMRKRLETFGYFEQFPDSMPPPANATNVWKDANAALTTLGFTKNKANTLLAQAWMYIKDNNPTASVWEDDANITPEFFVSKALKKKPMDATNKPSDQANGVSTSAAQTPNVTAPVSTPVSKPVSKPAGEAPVENPVSAPVSGGASAPVTTQATKPVSNKPTDPGNNIGKIELNGNELTWEHPKTHEVHTISADQLEKFAKKQPKFVQALKSHPELYDKFKALNQKKSEGGEQQKVQERIEYINPFSPENFL